ncbi:Ankyrin repeat protein 1 [Giardia muris]|uniref:Ankyrin repeat protein 1 n=1 Tax=Giardia muris TaxID=5742 RepID=A0A4Z1T5W1_GIAMU|nr:Ankyrin repeat protein 1 [Giardia muris]|eukprot:TNJ29443.1 Ankyrin repeat protein 1 [Giardia muris]
MHSRGEDPTIPMLAFLSSTENAALMRIVSLRSDDELAFYKHVFESVNSSLQTFVVQSRQLETQTPDEPHASILRINENGITRMDTIPIDAIASFSVRGYNLMHLTVLGYINTFKMIDFARVRPDAARLLLEMRSTNALQLLPIELSIVCDRHSECARRLVDCRSAALEAGFGDCPTTDVINTYEFLGMMNFVDYERLMQMALQYGSLCVFHKLYRRHSSLRPGTSFDDLVVKYNLHTVAATCLPSLNEIVQLMGTKIIYAYNENGLLPIHTAAFNASIDSLLYLLSLDINLLDSETRDRRISVVECALSSQNQACINIILKIIAERDGPDGVRNHLKHRFGRFGLTAFTLACNYNDLIVIHCCLQYLLPEDLVEYTRDIPEFPTGICPLDLLSFGAQTLNLYLYCITLPISSRRKLNRLLQTAGPNTSEFKSFPVYEIIRRATSIRGIISSIVVQNLVLGMFILSSASFLLLELLSGLTLQIIRALITTGLSAFLWYRSHSRSSLGTRHSIIQRLSEFKTEFSPDERCILSGYTDLSTACTICFSKCEKGEHCAYCKTCIPNRRFHSTFIRTCVSSNNGKYYIGVILTFLCQTAFVYQGRGTLARRLWALVHIITVLLITGDAMNVRI